MFKLVYRNLIQRVAAIPVLLVDLLDEAIKDLMVEFVEIC